MKLIDLLVKKTNEDGWAWPGKSTFCYQTKPEHGYITKFFDHNGVKVVDYCWEKCDDASAFNDLTKEQYESALAASGGWIEWGGGECPVEEGALVDIRDGDGASGMESRLLQRMSIQMLPVRFGSTKALQGTTSSPTACTNQTSTPAPTMTDWSRT